MLSERKLRKWRRIALLTKGAAHTNHTQTLADFILELTQELLGQKLIEQAKKEKK